MHDVGQKPLLFWRARQESNLRPLASEANTLSTELRALVKNWLRPYCKCLQPYSLVIITPNNPKTCQTINSYEQRARKSD